MRRLGRELTNNDTGTQTVAASVASNLANGPPLGSKQAVEIYRLYMVLKVDRMKSFKMEHLVVIEEDVGSELSSFFCKIYCSVSRPR
jgi:hypothetical protein